jgi:hypothetical protein
MRTRLIDVPRTGFELALTGLRLCRYTVGRGRWKDDLRRLPRSEQPADPQWIGLAKPHCVVLANNLLPSVPKP